VVISSEQPRPVRLYPSDVEELEEVKQGRGLASLADAYRAIHGDSNGEVQEVTVEDVEIIVGRQIEELKDQLGRY